MTTPALVIAAPSSGAGKTLLSLGIMAALRARGLSVRAAKSGPDYIDPAFHGAATGAPSVNLDAWAMGADELRARAGGQGGDVLIVEAAMGVLDAAADGRGSAADLAAELGAPVVLVLDIAKAGQSAALAPAGLNALRPDLELAGVILNSCGSRRHAGLAGALLPAGLPVFGAMPRDPSLALPARHLGLVQASETADLGDFLDAAARAVEAAVDLDALVAAARPLRPGGSARFRLQPLGQRIAVARDPAFAFAYPHMLDDWRAAGAELSFFSPLDDQPPTGGADAIFLPGGYPELHAAALSSADGFRAGMQAAAAAGTLIYGECGGYMTLGRTLTDAEGRRRRMLGLLPLDSSFAHPRLSLGYRRLTPLSGPFSAPLKGHEFHYATITEEGTAERLFRATDAVGAVLPEMGLRVGNVMGSFAHVIAPAASRD